MLWPFVQKYSGSPVMIIPTGGDSTDQETIRGLCDAQA
jgi:hypothetical protein